MMWNIFSYAVFSICTIVGEVSLKVMGLFFIELFVFLLPSFKNSFYILHYSLIMCLLKMFFSHVMVYLFILSIACFAEKKILILMTSNLSSLSFTDWAFGLVSKKSLPNSWPSIFSHVVSVL
jgi:hypothetical protein